MSTDTPLEAVLIGAGQRGAEAYAPYALQHPDQLVFTAVAEPLADRRERFAAAHNIPPERCFSSWEELLSSRSTAQAAVIATQDALHAAPAIAAMRTGHHVLLEKPIAVTLSDCETLIKVSEQTGRQLHVCHVLRYTRHMRLMREIIQSGVIGEVIDVDHRENVAYWHMAHSYVRGNWGVQAQSGPMILTKCVHDLDILPWLLDRKPLHLSSSGGLTHFRPENAPEGAPDRCTDGCPAAETCPYYAPHLYLGLEPFWHSYAETAAKGLPRWAAKKAADQPGLVRLLGKVYPPLRQISEYRGWPLTVAAQDPTPENLLEALLTGPYGRCVYHCGSDVVDHQVVSMQFEGGATVTLTMHGHSPVEHRSTRIEGTRGRLMAQLGNGGSWIDVELHRPQRRMHYDTSAAPQEGHGGGDSQLMAEFAASVRAGGNPPEVQAAARAALQAHRLAFLAEQARVEGVVIQLDKGGGENLQKIPGIVKHKDRKEAKPGKKESKKKSNHESKKRG
ncbi:MAG: Gfo/Idh/MocA family oxidoreductase [Bellilinea sp.]